MKYGELTMGQMEAVVNKLGGMDGVRRLLSGELSVASAAFLPFARDKIKDGWTLIEDVSEPGEISISSLELLSFLKSGESFVSGNTMADCAKENGANLGQRQAEYLLSHQEDIPQEWRQYYLVFPGTVWQAAHGYRGVPCLGWDGGRWDLRFGWLGSVWDAGDRLVRFSK